MSGPPVIGVKVVGVGAKSSGHVLLIQAYDMDSTLTAAEINDNVSVLQGAWPLDFESMAIATFAYDVARQRIRQENFWLVRLLSRKHHRTLMQPCEEAVNPVDGVRIKARRCCMAGECIRMSTLPLSRDHAQIWSAAFADIRHRQAWVSSREI